MTLLSYLLDRRTLARFFAGFAVAVPVGLYASSPYETPWMKAISFLIPLVTMIAVLRRTPDGALATVIRLDERFPGTAGDNVEFARGITEDHPWIHDRVLG